VSLTARHVAGNTFLVEPLWGRSRAIRQAATAPKRSRRRSILPVGLHSLGWPMREVAALDEHLAESGNPAAWVAVLLPHEAAPLPPLECATRRFGRTELAMPLLSLGCICVPSRAGVICPLIQITAQPGPGFGPPVERAVAALGMPPHSNGTPLRHSDETIWGGLAPEVPDPQRPPQTKVHPTRPARSSRPELEAHVSIAAGAQHLHICWPFIEPNLPSTWSRGTLLPVVAWGGPGRWQQQGPASVFRSVSHPLRHCPDS